MLGHAMVLTTFIVVAQCDTDALVLDGLSGTPLDKRILLSICLSIRPTICLSVCLSVCMSICLSVCLSVCQSVCLSVSVYVYIIILRYMPPC